ncbi:MAG TPA: hypothetical protein PLI86_07010 [bacterium]|nr:hypothetical protein [bacterium]
METRMIAAALSCLFAAALPGCRHAPAGSADGAAQRFYRAQGPVTDPGKHAGLYANLPRDVRGLCGVVQGAMLHVFWAEKHGVTLAEERKREVNLRTVERMLARIVELDPRPLAERREPSKRLVGNCRDHSVLLARCCATRESRRARGADSPRTSRRGATRTTGWSSTGTRHGAAGCAWTRSSTRCR